jgi:hypothetical protein
MRSKRRSGLRKTRQKYQSKQKQKQKGGEVPFPDGSVVITRLDPSDPTSPPVAVSKEFAEKEIFH